MHTVLFIQHASALGGSAMSLLFTAQGVARAGHRPVIALARPAEEVRRLYSEAGLEVIAWPGITPFEHTTAFWSSVARPHQWAPLARAIVGWETSLTRTRDLVAHVAPDIVHLNSVVLAPAALALRGLVPVVWHVREHPVGGHLGIRKSRLRKALLEWPAEVIFLSEAEKRAWVDGKRGVVIPNFVDLSTFGDGITRSQARQSLGIADDDEVVLYVGGRAKMKGAFVMIEALAQLATRRPKLRCLMPGASYTSSGRAVSRIARFVLPLIGSGTEAQQFERALQRAGVASICHRSPFTREMPAFLAACDVLAFPAIEPHFARPIVEAGAMERPSVASRSAITAEQVRDGETGLLTTPGDPRALADAIEALLADPRRAHAMGVLARETAHEKYSAARGTANIVAIYDRLHPGGTE